MRYAKKITAIFMAVLLCMAAVAVVPASAADTVEPQGTLTGGSITITNAKSGNTYKVYQLAYIESYNTATQAYSYKANSQWKTWLSSQNTYVTVDGQDYVTWKNASTSAADFAKAAAAKAKADTNIKPVSVIERTTNTTITINDLKLGYYLVVSTLGTICSLDTTNTSATIKEKNNTPTILKEVKEDSSGHFGKTNDASIGEEISFKVTATLYQGIDDDGTGAYFTIRDCLKKGFDQHYGISVKSNISGKGTLTADTDFIVEANQIINSDICNRYSLDTSYLDGYIYQIRFKPAFTKLITGTTTITIEYKSKLNSNAQISSKGSLLANPSYAQIIYTGNWISTEKSETSTYTWKIPVVKYTQPSTNNYVRLAGATFKLTSDSAGNTLIKFNANTTNNYLHNTSGSYSTFTTDSSGEFNLIGLDSGTYYLHETAAPAGYNKLAGPVKITVSNQGVLTIDSSATGTTVLLDSNIVKVQNNTGSLLPKTGGIGAVIFYTVDGIVILAFLIAIILRKRRRAAMPQSEE